MTMVYLVTMMVLLMLLVTELDCVSHSAREAGEDKPRFDAFEKKAVQEVSTSTNYW